MSGLVNDLRAAANAIARRGLNGWGNTMTTAADRIAALEVEVERLTALIPVWRDCVTDPPTTSGLYWTDQELYVYDVWRRRWVVPVLIPGAEFPPQPRVWCDLPAAPPGGENDRG